MHSTKFWIVSLLFLTCSLISTSSYAQQAEDSSKSNKSYFKLSAAYLSNAVYYGRKDSLTLPYLLPSITYHDKSGFYFEASLSYQASAGEGKIDATSFTAGYEYNSKNQKLSGDLYASKYFYSASSYSVLSEVKGSIVNYLTYNTGPVSINTDAEASFSSKTDVDVSLGLSHLFDLTNDGKWTVSPAALVNAGTQNFYENYFTKRKYSTRRRRRIAPQTNVIIIGKNFSILDYELSSPVYYDSRKWGLFITPTFSVPVNPIKYSLNNGASYTTEKLTNGFYMEIGAYIKL